MTIWQTLKIVWANIIKNRMRSFLTMLGMIIGVASVILLVSLVQSLYDSILDTYADMGINNVSVTILGRNGNMMIDEEDMYQYAAEHKDAIKGVTPTVYIGGTLYKNAEKIESSDVRGIDEYYTELTNKDIETGRTITFSDISTRQGVCVIGSYINQKLFGGKAKPGDTLRLNGEELTIIGILKALSNSSERSEDNCVFMPYTTAMRQFGAGNISTYEFYVKDRTQVAAATDDIEIYLFDIFRNTKSYKIQNMVDLLNDIDQELSIFSTAIAAIAGISLVVAGVGIMNIMLVSVSERIKEIGIRKSLGAKHKDIMRQFVLEAGATSTLGGVLGILLGTALTMLAGNLLKIEAFPTTNSIFTAFTVSVSIGILFGYLPARKAAKLNPIDALRSE